MTPSGATPPRWRQQGAALFRRGWQGENPRGEGALDQDQGSRFGLGAQLPTELENCL